MELAEPVAVAFRQLGQVAGHVSLVESCGSSGAWFWFWLPHRAKLVVAVGMHKGSVPARISCLGSLCAAAARLLRGVTGFDAIAVASSRTVVLQRLQPGGARRMFERRQWRRSDPEQKTRKRRQ